MDLTPPEWMTTEERLNEVAQILARAGDRLKTRAKERGYDRLSPYTILLQAQYLDLPCFPDDRFGLRNTGRQRALVQLQM